MSCMAFHGDMASIFQGTGDGIKKIHFYGNNLFFPCVFALLRGTGVVIEIFWGSKRVQP